MFEGKNIQVYSRENPKENERELVLILVDESCSKEDNEVKKEFTVTASLGDLFVRKTRFLEFGSTCELCNKQMKVRVEWRDKPSWKFFEKDENGQVVSK